jgi:hypothetical protein
MADHTPPDTKTAPSPAPADADLDPLVQYLVVRKDLLKKPFGWSTGSLIANACHARYSAVRDIVRVCACERGCVEKTLGCVHD